MTEHDNQYDDLPDALIDALKGSDDVAIMTAGVDREVASLAADHFSNRKSGVQSLRPVWAAAAGLALAAVIAVQFQTPTRENQNALARDVDQSGQIDIADVFALARLGEGVDQAELDAFAMSIVSLSDEGETS